MDSAGTAPVSGAMRWLLVMLGIAGAAGVGFGIGVAAERHWRLSEYARRYRVQQRQVREAMADSGRRRRDPLQWRKDSLEQARFIATMFSIPREIGRLQVHRHCAVSFEIRDTTYRRSMVFHAEARSARTSSPIVAEGWTYSPRGWAQFDTLAVVLPNVFCGDIAIGGFGGSWAPPPRPLELDIR